MKKKQTLVAVFSHPDDEAFGPGGTLAKYTNTHDVYIICATKGESGQNHEPHSDKHISEIRSEELLNSAKILGVKKVFFLDYLDGTLCNNMYHELSKKVLKIIEKITPEILLTFEYRGVSGHIDHIVMSMVTNYIFDKYQPAKKLLMYCIDESHRQHISDYFIHFPKGYKPHEIHEVVDISSVWDKKIIAMHQHKSQKGDLDRILKRLNKLPKEEYFLVRSK